MNIYSHSFRNLKLLCRQARIHNSEAIFEFTVNSSVSYRMSKGVLPCMYIFPFPRISMNQYSSNLLLRYSNFSIKSIRIAKSVIHVHWLISFIQLSAPISGINTAFTITYFDCFGNNTGTEMLNCQHNKNNSVPLLSSSLSTIKW